MGTGRLRPGGPLTGSRDERPHQPAFAPRPTARAAGPHFPRHRSSGDILLVRGTQFAYIGDVREFGALQGHPVRLHRRCSRVRCLPGAPSSPTSAMFASSVPSRGTHLAYIGDVRQFGALQGHSPRLHRRCSPVRCPTGALISPTSPMFASSVPYRGTHLAYIGDVREFGALPATAHRSTRRRGDLPNSPLVRCRSGWGRSRRCITRPDQGTRGESRPVPTAEPLSCEPHTRPDRHSQMPAELQTSFVPQSVSTSQ